MLYFKKKPTNCPRNDESKSICSGMDNGWCVFKDKHPQNEQRCSCNVGFYGSACEYKMCPGIAKNLYRHDAMGTCSNTETETRGTCNRNTGLCTCNDKEGDIRRYYHGPKRACDFARAPPSKSTNVDNKCSGRGRSFKNQATGIIYADGYDKIRGDCHCKIEFWGKGCEFKKCPHSNGVLYPSISSNACNGRGACSTETGRCTCGTPYRGTSCEFEDCADDCRASGKDACNTQTGHCSCKAPTFGPACEFRSCPNDCSGGGECNRNDGKCICKVGYSGIQCERTARCSGPTLDTPYVNWRTIWDKPGWITCPTGQLMYRLKRSLCSALSCINTGGCAAGCEGKKHVFQTRHCYHDLRWYNSFDAAGWSKCLPDYFISGMYRAGESLYQLQMVKCCSLKEARWVKCGEANWDSIFNGPGTGKISPDSAFITGFKRSEGQTIKAIDGASYCGFVRGY